jgi:hypothetical protein
VDAEIKLLSNWDPLLKEAEEDLSSFRKPGSTPFGRSGQERSGYAV